MKKEKLPRGLSEARVRRIIKHYESQGAEAAIAEDEAAFKTPKRTIMQIPRKLVPKVRALIARNVGG